jgi:hypothetical protein
MGSKHHWIALTLSKRVGNFVYAVLVGRANGDGAWGGLVTIVESTDPRPYIFQPAVYGRLIYIVIYVRNCLLTQQNPNPHLIFPPDMRRLKLEGRFEQFLPGTTRSNAERRGTATWRSTSLSRWRSCPSLTWGPSAAATTICSTRWAARPGAGPHLSTIYTLNSVSGLVSKAWYRFPFGQSELSSSKLSPTDSPKVRPGRYP